MGCVFDDIINNKKKSEKIYETENIIAIKDIFPKAPIHILIIPKKHIESIQDIGKDDLYLISEVILVAQKLAEKFNIKDNYRLLTNCGKKAGQSIFHLHFHFISGNDINILEL